MRFPEVEVPLTDLIVGEVSPNPKTGAYPAYLK
mgnify:CR=1 FL=1